MASVVFAFGAKPGLPGNDALELARLLSLTRTTAGNSAAEKIRPEAKRGSGRREASTDVELDAEEIEILVRVLEEEPWPKEQEWFQRLYDEARNWRAET
jgi:hypothetical protein